jgi:hypothetical protein
LAFVFALDVVAAFFAIGAAAFASDDPAGRTTASAKATMRHLNKLIAVREIGNARASGQSDGKVYEKEKNCTRSKAYGPYLKSGFGFPTASAGP